MEPVTDYPTTLRVMIILASLFLGTFLVAIDTTIVSVAIPKISTEFHSLDDVGWYGSAYLITITALQPAGGTLYKLFPAKTIYLTAIIIFEAGSALCAAAPTSVTFILGRTLAGIGAALLIQGAISIITHVSALEKRPLYISVVVSCFGICASFSPVLGGVLTVYASWRWCFWINLPIGAVVFGLVFLSMKLKAKDGLYKDLSFMAKMRYLDPIGIALLFGAFTCLFLALQWGGNGFAWRSARVIGLLIGFGLLLIVFCMLQWRLDEKATIPYRILRHRTASYGALSLFLISMSSNIKLYYLPFYFQAVRGSSALRSGIAFLALAVPQVVATVSAGGLTTETGHYFPIMLVGTIICSLGTGLLVRLGTLTPTIFWTIPMVIAGFGDGMCTNMPYTAIQAIFQDEGDVMIGNAIATFGTLAGGAIGISVGENILASRLLDEVPKFTAMISPQAVIGSGALNLDKLTTSPVVLCGLRQAYGRAISAVMVCATVAICTAIVTTLGMQRLNLKTISKERGNSNHLFAANAEIKGAPAEIEMKP